jgi:putative multiple sugar transport system substrate-binding protein
MGHFLVNSATGSGNPLYLYAGGAADNNSFLFFEGAWNILQPYIADGTFVIVNSSEAVALQDQLNLTRPEMANIVGQVTTGWLPEVAMNLAQANLVAAGSENKGEVFVLAPNDGTALAIANTFLADPEITSLFITGQDAEIPSVQAILNGIQSMTVFKDVRELADDAVEVATAILSGTTPQTNGFFDNGAFEVPSMLTEVHEVTADNLVEMLVDSGFISADMLTLP